MPIRDSIIKSVLRRYLGESLARILESDATNKRDESGDGRTYQLFTATPRAVTVTGTMHSYVTFGQQKGPTRANVFVDKPR